MAGGDSAEGGGTSVHTTEVLAVFTVVAILVLQVSELMPRALPKLSRWLGFSVLVYACMITACFVLVWHSLQYGLAALKRLTEHHRHLEQMLE
jgi:hypothetical protein